MTENHKSPLPHGLITVLEHPIVYCWIVSQHHQSIILYCTYGAIHTFVIITSLNSNFLLPCIFRAFRECSTIYPPQYYQLHTQQNIAFHTNIVSVMVYLVSDIPRARVGRYLYSPKRRYRRTVSDSRKPHPWLMPVMDPILVRGTANIFGPETREQWPPPPFYGYNIH